MKVICNDADNFCAECEHAEEHEHTPRCKLLCDFKNRKCVCVDVAPVFDGNTYSELSVPQGRERSESVITEKGE